MAKELSGIDVYKKIKTMKPVSAPEKETTPAPEAAHRVARPVFPQLKSGENGSGAPDPAAGARSRHVARSGGGATADRLADGRLDMHELREEVHRKVSRDGFTPDRDPSYFDRVESAGLVKQGLQVKGAKKAAKFLMLLDQDQAVAVLNQLSQSEVEAVMKEIAAAPQRIEKEEAVAILREFKFLRDRTELPHGGVDTARSILVNAMGDDKGRAFLQRVVPEAEEHPFAFLADADATQLFLLLKKESADVVALIMPHLPPKTASELLRSFSGGMQADVAKKIARRKRPAPMALAIVEERLQESFRKMGQTQAEPVDGSGALANILKYVSPQMEQEIIDEIRCEDPSLSHDVRDKLFTIDMIVSVNDADLQKVLQDYSDADLAVLLKGKNREIENKIYNSISERRAAIIRYERTLLGPMKREEVEKATKAFLAHLRKLQLQGEIRIYDPNENYV